MYRETASKALFVAAYVLAYEGKLIFFTCETQKNLIKLTYNEVNGRSKFNAYESKRILKKKVFTSIQ